jgi:hypothetical protein
MFAAHRSHLKHVFADAGHFRTAAMCLHSMLQLRWNLVSLCKPLSSKYSSNALSYRFYTIFVVISTFFIEVIWKLSDALMLLTQSTVQIQSWDDVLLGFYTGIHESILFKRYQYTSFFQSFALLQRIKPLSFNIALLVHNDLLYSLFRDCDDWMHEPMVVLSYQFRACLNGLFVLRVIRSCSCSIMWTVDAHIHTLF